MLDPHGLMVLMQLRRDDLLREAAAQHLVDEALETAPLQPPPALRVPGWRQAIGHLKLRARLESTSG
jgi:hypothetical protein